MSGVLQDWAAMSVLVITLTVRGLRCAGLVIGSWPATPELACRCNQGDLPECAAAKEVLT